MTSHSLPSSSPRARDGQATRAAILDAAAEVFADRGFDGASLRDLAEAAGVTRSLIHHHFGSKEELWESVVDRFFMDYGRRQAEILARPHLQADGLEESARTLFRFLAKNPRFVRLHSWANTSESDAPIRASRQQLALQAVERLEEMQQRGDMRSDIRPASVLIAMFNLVEHWFQAHTTLAKRLGDEMPSESEFLEDLVRVLIRGIQPCDPLSTRDA